MSIANDRYRACRERLLQIRKDHGGYYSEAEETLLDEMDGLWSQMTADELATIRAEGSWKFPAPPAAAQ